MRLLTVPRSYRRYMVSALDITKVQIEQDVALRSDECSRVQRLAGVPNGFIEPEKSGSLLIVTIDVESANDVAALHQILAAFAKPVAVLLPTFAAKRA